MTTWHERAHQGVAHFMVGYNLFLLRVEHAGFALQSRHHALKCLVKIGHGNMGLSAPSRQQGRFINQIGQVGPAESGGKSGQGIKIQILSEFDLFHMHAQKGFPPHFVRAIDHPLAIKAPRPTQGRIEEFRATGDRQDDHPGIGFKAIHLGQQLI